MSEKIDKQLKKTAEDILKVSSQTSSNTERIKQSSRSMIGDPDCPFCRGLGYLRKDLPVGHPEFGKALICKCRQDEIEDLVKKRLFSFSHLEQLSQFTFENFQPRGRVGLPPKQAQSLELAYNQAKQFSQSFNGWLFLLGPYGTGKTHLAAAIANFVVSLGKPTLFLTVPDLLDLLRFTFNDADANFEERFDQIRNVPLLVMDDFGTHNATSWAQEKLFQIINYRYINQLPLVVTTNNLLNQIEPRIRSRLEDPDLVTVVRIKAPDYRKPSSDFGQHELSSLDIMHAMTFASFDNRKAENLTANDFHSLETALKGAIKFANDPQGWAVFTGPHGCGKTHLAAAIGNFLKELGSEPIFVSVPEMLDHLRATFSPDSTVSLDRRFEEIRTASLLILDDLGTKSATAWAREKLYQLFDYRYYTKLPTVITTAEEMEEVDLRLKSRMFDKRLCDVYGITAPIFTGTVRSRRK